MIRFKKPNGFTLLEVLLYMALVAMMMSYLTPMAWNMILGRQKIVTQQEISTQARLISERIKSEIRNASNLANITSTRIRLRSTDSTKDPIIIDYNSNRDAIRIRFAGGDFIDLNSDDTIVTNFTFTDYSTSANTTSRHIGFEFTLQTNNTSQRKEFSQSVSIRGSAEIRSN